MRVIYSPRYEVDLGPHVFPTRKYGLVHRQLLDSQLLGPSRLRRTGAGDVGGAGPSAHNRVPGQGSRDGSFTPEELALLELPWSAGIVEGFRTMTGGTATAAAMVCGFDRDPELSSNKVGERRDGSDSRIVCHIGGGLHHAFANHGEGFCLFNDVAVAVRLLQASGLQRFAIVDLDVHHGNGTAFIFESDPRVFTFSMHQQLNYPMWKPRGSLDIGLADGTSDEQYLRHLEESLPKVMGSDPQCVFYLAGADPYEDDQLGGLRLTSGGLRRRDRLVIEAVGRAGVPLVITLAGGYARQLEDTVAIHVATIEEAIRLEAGS